MARVGRILRRHPLLFAAFVLATVLTLFLAGRAVMFAVYWADPDHRDQAIEGWMTPRYVARSWDLPPEALQDALGRAIPPPGERSTLAEIAAASGIPLPVLAARIVAAAEAHRAGQP